MNGWTPENIAALVTGLTALAGAIGGIIALFRHVNNPTAHGGTANVTANDRHNTPGTTGSATGNPPASTG